MVSKYNLVQLNSLSWQATLLIWWAVKKIWVGEGGSIWHWGTGHLLRGGGCTQSPMGHGAPGCRVVRSFNFFPLISIYLPQHNMGYKTPERLMAAFGWLKRKKTASCPKLEYFFCTYLYEEKARYLVVRLSILIQSHLLTSWIQSICKRTLINIKTKAWLRKNTKTWF